MDKDRSHKLLIKHHAEHHSPKYEREVALRMIEEAVRHLLDNSMISSDNWKGIMMVEDWLGKEE